MTFLANPDGTVTAYHDTLTEPQWRRYAEIVSAAGANLPQCLTAEDAAILRSAARLLSEGVSA